MVTLDLGSDDDLANIESPMNSSDDDDFSATGGEMGELLVLLNETKDENVLGSFKF